MQRLTFLLRRAKRIVQTEGRGPLARRALAFVMAHFFEHRSYYLYRYDLERVRSLDRASLLPQIDRLTCKMVSTNRQADELEAEGFGFRSYSVNARRRLDSGAMAFCVFVGQELGSIAWVALDQKAKDSFNEPPVEVDFAGGEAWVGGYWTSPKHRRMGLHLYNITRTVEYPLERGFHTERYVIEKKNNPSQTAEARFGSEVYAEGRYLRVLWWRSWKERPLTEGDQCRS
ncbi:MAG: hypothetical protein SVP26_08080 [Chloroflexota bacterium]|nr:hypothetical protein [Chloroflexota bacterium]